MLQLNKNWRINADAFNWTLERRGFNKNTQEEYWTAKSYHGTLEQALNRFCDNTLKRRFGNTELDLTEVLTAIDGLKKSVAKACKGITKQDIAATEEIKTEDFDFLN